MYQRREYSNLKSSRSILEFLVLSARSNTHGITFSFTSSTTISLTSTGSRSRSRQQSVSLTFTFTFTSPTRTRLFTTAARAGTLWMGPERRSQTAAGRRRREKTTASRAGETAAQLWIIWQTCSRDQHCERCWTEIQRAARGSQTNRKMAIVRIQRIRAGGFVASPSTKCIPYRAWTFGAYTYIWVWTHTIIEILTIQGLKRLLICRSIILHAQNNTPCCNIDLSKNQILPAPADHAKL